MAKGLNLIFKLCQIIKWPSLWYPGKLLSRHQKPV